MVILLSTIGCSDNSDSEGAGNANEVINADSDSKSSMIEKASGFFKDETAASVENFTNGLEKEDLPLGCVCKAPVG